MTGGAQDSGAGRDKVTPEMMQAWTNFEPVIPNTPPSQLRDSVLLRQGFMAGWLAANRATPAPAGWQPRIGEEVRVSEETAERWPDWRDTRLWVVGVSMDRNVSGTPAEGLNVCVSDEWPVTNRTGGFTDGFYINRPYAGDDLRPLPTAPAEGGV